MVFILHEETCRMAKRQQGKTHDKALSGPGNTKLTNDMKERQALSLRAFWVLQALGSYRLISLIGLIGPISPINLLGPFLPSLMELLMSLQSSHPARWAWFSPWLIIGSVCLLAGILLVLAVKNIHREREFMERALLSQANVLMRSLEAGSRTGMMGMGWGKRQLQLLMEQTAQQPDVHYVGMVTSRGQIIFHSDPDRVGSILSVTLPKPGGTVYRFLEEGQKSFEVIRFYQPWTAREGGRGQSGRGQGGKGHGEGVCSAFPAQDIEGDLFVVVGLDPGPFEDALSQDLHQTALLFGLMFLVGAAGFLSLVWAQHYRTARRSLLDVQAFTSTVVNQMPVGLMATDRNGNIQRANEAAQRILQSNNLSGKLDGFGCFVPVARRLQKEEAVIEEEVQCQIDENRTVPLLVNAARIRDAERQTAGYVFLFMDITNIRQLEEQLRRSERLASLGRLAAGIAHEIRNPLSSIKGFATILANRFKEDDRGRNIVEVMVQEVERLNRVISELLDFARPTEIHKHPHPCKDLIEHTLRLIEKDAEHQGVKIEARVEPEDLRVQVDPDRFAQVLLNLYLNAIQAMENGGALRVGASRQTGQVLFTIDDSGPGILPEHLSHIFDPYFTTKPKGVGLGLANVHKLVEAHGGDIEVVSTPGQGASFIVHLPSEGET